MPPLLIQSSLFLQYLKQNLLQLFHTVNYSFDPSSTTSDMDASSTNITTNGSAQALGSTTELISYLKKTQDSTFLYNHIETKGGGTAARPPVPLVSIGQGVAFFVISYYNAHVTLNLLLFCHSKGSSELTLNKI